ncbi:MAG: hypothetical protein KatS3mg105_5047 [Gemmatales bacterium]|nr:MAG: hypothetical protein KatS3mg105_5047 [Gemmatales bacterium]
MRLSDEALVSVNTMMKCYGQYQEAMRQRRESWLRMRQAAKEFLLWCQKKRRLQSVITRVGMSQRDADRVLNGDYLPSFKLAYQILRSFYHG